MNRTLLGFAALAAVVAALAVPGAASAAPASTSFAVTGSEYAFTSTVGSFAGTGFGNLGDVAFFWNTTVVHDALGSTPPIWIDGGSLKIDTVGPTGKDEITASFVYHGGTITQTVPGTNCTNQKYSVVGLLDNVATNTTAGGTGNFSVTLTHHRARFPIVGCTTYAATVSGSATFMY
jgi:hypothetical protein